MRPPSGAQALLLLPFLTPVLALILSAPERCGGTHVVTHASAFFGPKPGTSAVRDVALFAPRAQKAGFYVRHLVAHAPRSLRRTAKGRRARKLKRILGVVRNARKAVQKHLENLATSGTYARDAGMGVGGVVDTVAAGDAAHPPGETDTAEGEREPATFTTATLPRVRESNSLLQPQGDADRTDDAVAKPADVPREGDEPADENHSSPNRTASQAFALFDACTRLSVAADITAMKGRVAVVARGNCDFTQKVILMQDAGAVGVIVVNRKDADKLANMKVNDTKELSTQVTIPAVMISHHDWNTILPCRNDTKVAFTAEGEASFDIDFGRDALNWTMMRGMALWILCQCGVNVVRYKRRMSEFRARADAIAALPVETYSRPENMHDDDTSVAEESSHTDQCVTESIPAPKVAGPAPTSPILDHDPERAGLIASSDGESVAASSSAGPTPSSASTAFEDERDGEEEESVCAVCLDNFETGQQVRFLACGHLYHRVCIDPWLQSSSNCCPLCKREVPNLPPPPTQLHYGSMSV